MKPKTTPRLTARCQELFKLLQSGRWLTTTQIHRRFFPKATLDAARKRLRKLAAAGYLRQVQRYRAQEALFTLGSEGKRVLEAQGAPETVLERKPPAHLAHLLGINDVRAALELEAEVSFFFAHWELSALRWTEPVIPDALFRVRGRTFALELDCGSEGLTLVRKKIAHYRRSLNGCSLHGLLVVADGRARMQSLARAISGCQVPVLFSTIDLIRQHGIRGKIFHRSPDGEGVPLV